MSSAGDPALDVVRMSKSFDGTHALDSVSLSLRRGSVHALVGQNGSGKSTLIKILSGFHRPENDTIVRVDGREVELGHSDAAYAAGLRFVHQDLALIDTLSVSENLAFGRGFDTDRSGRIRWRAERERARQALGALGLDLDVRRPVGEFTEAERTGVAIARALWDWEQGARVLVLDEPTASLPRAEVEVLFRSVRAVRNQGLAVLYVSHRLDEVFAIADEVTVLRDGRSLGTFPVDSLDEDGLIKLMVGEAITRTRSAGQRMPGNSVLAVRNLCGTVLHDVGFEVRAGEIVGFAGLTGSGREELLPMLFGASPRTGQVSVRGNMVRASQPQSAVDAGLALIPSDRLHQGGVMDLAVATNLTLTGLRELRNGFGAIRGRRERHEVADWMRRLEIRPLRPDLPLSALSGGNQQKVVIAKWLRRAPDVLLLDEPTQGVDIGAKVLIHRLLRQCADDGAAVLIASGDDEEICDVCDRVYVLRDGSLAHELDHRELTIDRLGYLQLGSQLTD